MPVACGGYRAIRVSPAEQGPADTGLHTLSCDGVWPVGERNGCAEARSRPAGARFLHMGAVAAASAGPRADAKGGALTTFGQHKGFGLALLGDILGGSFSGGGAYLPEREVSGSITNNMLAILIDPNVFGMAEAFGVDMDSYADWVKASPPAPGVASVQFPGDPERQSAKERHAQGIPLDDGTVAQLIAAANAAAVPQSDLTVLTDTV